METSLKTDFAQIFSHCPKNLSCPKFGGAAAPLAPPARTPMGLTQLSTEPTCVTQYSSTLIDFCLTNSPDKISKSGVINIGKSDHSAIYLTRKVTDLRSNMHKTVEVRQFKNFNDAEFFARSSHDWLEPCYHAQ